MSEGKILIMGVGGCGSGFIWGLLGDLGLSNGGINEYLRHSGIRGAIANGTADNWEFPRVIKHLGGFLNNINEHVDRHNWKVEHVFFAVASYDLQMHSYHKRNKKRHPGKTKEEMLKQYTEKYQSALGKGLLNLIDRDYPFTVIRCPRSIKDPKYCYDKLKVVLGDVSYEEFEKAHQARISPRHLGILDGYK